MENQQTKEKSSDRHDTRAEIAHQGIRGLIILNGGACVALLALLQSLWSKPSNPHPLVTWLLWSILIYALGTLAGAAIFIPRYFTSLRYEQGNLKKAKRWERLSWGLQVLPLVLFLAGTIIVFIGGLCAL